MTGSRPGAPFGATDVRIARDAAREIEKVKGYVPLVGELLWLAERIEDEVERSGYNVSSGRKDEE